MHAANLQDRDGGALLVGTLFRLFPFLRKFYADAGYQGPRFRAAVHRVLPQADLEIVKRSDYAQGFEVLPRRWIVEHTIAWLNRCRHLAKDWECLNRKALAFWCNWQLVMIYVDMYWLVMPTLGVDEVPFGLIDLTCWVTSTHLLPEP